MQKRSSWVGGFTLFVSMMAFAHGDASQVPAADLNELQLQRVNELYQEKIESIFEQKCFDCHSTKPRYPWYYAIPGIKQLIDNDIEEGMHHFDFTNGFPFKGHHPLQEQLEEIKESVIENTMPPWDYRLIHWNSSLTEKEKESILQWVEQGQKTLP